MDEETVWTLVYASVMAMRLHPRNDDTCNGMTEALQSASTYAAYAAAMAVNDRRRVWQSSQRSEQPA